MSTNRIKLVAGDTKPIVQVQLTNADGSALDVTGAACVVAFRAEGGTATLSRLACTPVSTGSDGWIKFGFPAGVPATPGAYEGEVEITFADTSKQTVFDLLKFTVRARFA